MTDVRRVLLDQLEVAAALLDFHLEHLVDEDLHWQPAAVHWAVRDVGGRWVPDWADEEPSPIPVPTVAWTTWHLGWWWTTALAHLRDEEAPGREDVLWPGDAASVVNWLRGIHQEWRGALAVCERLGAAAEFPWPPGSGRTVADLVAWAHVELTKNASELGQLVLLRRAGVA